jgi:anti-sigma B factor antagonist
MAALDFEVVDDGDATAVRLAGELDMDGVLRLEPALIELVERHAGRSVTLDLREVTLIDSTGLGLVMQTHEAARRSRCTLAILAAPESVQRVFRLAGLEDILPFAPADP